jgi:hypothetical protein
MRAPFGHPFFGNQYTNGGYVNGSYTYDAARLISDTIASRSKPNNGANFAFLRETFAIQRMPALSISSLVAVGAVALIGGVATYAYLRTRSASPIDADLGCEKIASFGVCESCGEALASTGPAELHQDERGDFVVCENCSHENRAKYSQDAD